MLLYSHVYTFVQLYAYQSLKQDRNNANKWKSSLSKFVMGEQSHVLPLVDNLNHFFWGGSCFAPEFMPSYALWNHDGSCAATSTRISMGRGSTVSFSRLLLNKLHMKIAKDVDAQNVGEVRQGYVTALASSSLCQET